MALWMVLCALACAGPAPPERAQTPRDGAVPPPEVDMYDSCTVRIAPGQPIQPALQEGAVVCLAPGVHAGGLRVEVSVDILGEPGAVLDGAGRGSVVHVAANGIELRMRGIELRGGAAEFGSGLLVDAYAQVALEDCRVVANSAGQGRGAGIGMARGRLMAQRLHTDAGSDLFVDGVAEAALDDCSLEGGLHARDGAKVGVRGGRIAAPLTLAGTTTRRPRLVLEGVEAPPVENSPTLPGELRRN